MRFKHFYFLPCVFLLVACSFGVTIQNPDQLVYSSVSKTYSSGEELCVDENGDTISYDPDDGAPYVPLNPVETSDQGAIYEIPSWNMRFFVSVEYAAFIPYWLERDGFGTLVIDDVSSEECLPVGDGAMASIYFSPVRTYDTDGVGVYTNVDDLLEDGWHDPGDYLSVRSFDLPFFTVYEYREQSFGHTELVSNYFVWDGILYSMGTLDCETYCPAASVMAEILSHLQPIQDFSTASALSNAIYGMAQSYLRLLGPRADWQIDLDEENYYATVSSYHYDGSAILAFFLYPDGESLLAVSVLGCGPICHQDFVFLKHTDNGWHDVTDAVFPVLTQEELEVFSAQFEDFAGLYVLPQEGTTITFINQYDYTAPPLYTFTWKDGVFVKQKVE